MSRSKRNYVEAPNRGDFRGFRLTRFAAKQIAKKVDRMAESLGWDASHYISISSTSRYITLRRGGITIRVRIADHASSRSHHYFNVLTKQDRERLREWLMAAFGDAEYGE